MRLMLSPNGHAGEANVETSMLPSVSANQTSCVRFRLTFCIERALDRYGVVGCAGYRALENEKHTSNERDMAPPTGFEPATYRVETGCAIRCATGAKSDHHNLHRIGVVTATDMHHVGCSNRNR